MTIDDHHQASSWRACPEASTCKMSCRVLRIQMYKKRAKRCKRLAIDIDITIDCQMSGQPCQFVYLRLMQKDFVHAINNMQCPFSTMQRASDQAGITSKMSTSTAPTVQYFSPDSYMFTYIMLYMYIDIYIDI